MSNRLPGMGKIALGSVEMVLQSIHDYMRENRGALPLKIELHPAVMADFFEDYRCTYAGHVGANTILELLREVPIMPCSQVEQPRLITRTGGIQYL